jgi:hypothetical protein
MAPQFGPGGPNGQNGQACVNDGTFSPCNTSNNNLNNTTPSVKHLNVPLLALGLSLAGFLIICLVVCLCTYQSAKARNRAARNLIPEEMEQGEYIGLGLGLQERVPIAVMKVEDTQTENDNQAPPAYSPKPSTSPKRLQPQASGLTLGGCSGLPTPLLSLSPSPALTAPVSPALSSYTLSPALSQGENEEAGLLGGRRALTPPPPTYVR